MKNKHIILKPSEFRIHFYFHYLYMFLGDNIYAYLQK